MVEGRRSGEGTGAPERPSDVESKGPEAKSCKGCLYYSSTLKSNSRNPRCIGITRSFPQVPWYYVGESEMEASKGGQRSSAYFKYACVGYSVYLTKKDGRSDLKETSLKLPACSGFKLLAFEQVSSKAPAPAHTRDDGRRDPQARTHKPAHAVGDDFSTRLMRNANLVASGMSQNMRKVGIYAKEKVDNVLDPYRRRPK